MALNPKRVRAIQLSWLKKLGYPKAAGMNEKKFAELVPMPENKSGALVVISAKLVPIDKQMKLIKGKNYLDISKLKDEFTTDQLIYWIYGVENGQDRIGRLVDDCIKEFKEQGKRGLTVVEGIALIVQRKVNLKKQAIDLTGSRYEQTKIACLELNDDTIELDDNFPDAGTLTPWFGAASCVI